MTETIIDRYTEGGVSYKIVLCPCGRTKVERDEKANRAKKPACARYADNTARYASRRKADSVKKVDA